MALPDALQPLVAAPGRSGLLTDFDGTLAPIVDDPAASRPLPAGVDALHQLAGRLAMVAVVSGRPVSFLEQHLGGSIHLSGLYGLEQVFAGSHRHLPEAERWRPVVAEAAAAARRDLGDLVEEKGLSLTLHFRTAPGRAEEVLAFAAAEAARTGLEVRPARASVELHPPVEADKGTALEALAGGLDAACFLGDDVGDLTAFDGLDRLAAAGAHTVRIAVRSDESPEELLLRADLVVEGPEGAAAVLGDLVRALDAG